MDMFLLLSKNNLHKYLIELGLEDHCHTDMWAIVELKKTLAAQTCGPSLTQEDTCRTDMWAIVDSGALLQENTSGDPRGVANAHKPS